METVLRHILRVQVPVLLTTLVVEAAVSESESVDGDFFPPVEVSELPSQADRAL